MNNNAWYYYVVDGWSADGISQPILIFLLVAFFSWIGITRIGFGRGKFTQNVCKNFFV